MPDSHALRDKKTVIHPKIAALYVEKDGPYFGLPHVDPWPIERDARKYRGPFPVVAHPPCERWGRYWSGGPSAKVRRARPIPVLPFRNKRSLALTRRVNHYYDFRSQISSFAWAKDPSPFCADPLPPIRSHEQKRQSRSSGQGMGRFEIEHQGG